MNYPKFYDEAPKFKLYDLLSDFLGASEDGLIEISYLDCVKLAGHSCPTVAGAYIMTYRALEYLYEDKLPVRSEIEIRVKNPKSEGVTGVIGNVVGFICGASDEGGFAGIAGKFNRKNLISFGNSDINGDILFKRLDNQKAVTLKLDTSIVPANPQMMPLMQRALQDGATKEDKEAFAQLWQQRVEAMLTNSEIWSKIAIITQEA